MELRWCSVLWSLAIFSILVCVESNLREEVSAPKTAVIYDDSVLLESHSQLMQHISDMGHEISAIAADNCDSLESYGKNRFQNLVVLSASKQDSFKLTVNDFTDYLDRGGNLILGVDSEAPSKLRTLINELGFNMLSSGSFLGSGNSTFEEGVVMLDPINSIINAKPIVDRSAMRDRPLLFKGNVLKYMPENPDTINVVTAPKESFVYSEASKSLHPSVIKGFPMVLVGALQMKNNYRAVVIPSLDMISDRFIGARFGYNGKSPVTSSNGQLLKELLLWVFLEKSVLRVTHSEHALFSTNLPKKPYSVMEKIRYTVSIEELTPNGWVPFVSNDVLFALERIITHMRVYYNNTSDGNYSVVFHIPDYIGLYKCETLYRRIGYTNVNHYQHIVVRPRRHDEFPRFIVKCWPLYASPFLMLAMTISLSFILINMKESKEKAE